MSWIWKPKEPPNEGGCDFVCDNPKPKHVKKPPAPPSPPKPEITDDTIVFLMKCVHLLFDRVNTLEQAQHADETAEKTG